MKRIHAKLGWVLYRLLFPLLIIWFYSIGARRSRVLVFNHRGQLLLVRSWFGHQKWTLPGGGIKLSESTQAGAARELYEETGFKLNNLELTDQKWLGDTPLKYMAYIFKGRVDSEDIPGPARGFKHEILDIKWFDIDKAPKHVKQRYGDYI